MSGLSQERRQEIMALEPRLLESAIRMTRDANEAKALVSETLAAARASPHQAHVRCAAAPPGGQEPAGRDQSAARAGARRGLSGQPTPRGGYHR